MAIPPLRRRSTVEEYYRMAQAGIVTEEDRVELIEGEIIQMTPIGSRHQACVDRVAKGLSRLAGDTLLVVGVMETSTYAQVTTLRRGQSASTAAFPGVTIAVDELLG